MDKIEYKQAVYANDKFDHWHYWGFMPDMTFVGPDMANGIAHALANSHPYVTDDRNGDKVFAGDKVKFKHIVIEVLWNKMFLKWEAKNLTDKEFDSLSVWNLSEKFELIKDSDK